MDGEAASASGLVFPTAAAGGEQNMRELVTLPLPGTEGNAIHYHSLLAEIGSSVGLRNHQHHLQRFREFVIFHGDQIYPEFLVAYKRARK